MARHPTIHPGNYRSSGNIDDEFSSVIRYLVSGEEPYAWRIVVRSL